MQRLKVRQLVAKIYILWLLIWGVASFFLFFGLSVGVWPIVAVSIIAGVLTIYGRAKQFLLVIASFLLLYNVYGFQFTYNFPLWLAITLLLVCSTLLFFFIYCEQSRVAIYLPLYLTLFALVNIETYLVLSYWLVNPLSRSLLAAINVYVFSGYIESIGDNLFNREKFYTYLFTAAGLLVILLVTSSWGR